MPLAKGKGTIRANVNELMKGVQSPARAKAIATLARKYGISKKEAMFKQATRIAQAQARKK